MATTAPHSPTTAHGATEAHDAAPGATRPGLFAEPTAPGRYLAIRDEEPARLVVLRDSITHLGRGFAADVRLEDQSVSRRHAIIVNRADGARLLDEHSSNGTYVNGRRVFEAKLRHGDLVVIGRVAITFVEVGA